MGYDYYDYGTTYDASSAIVGVLSGLMMFSLIIIIIVAIVGILQIIATWKVFKKAGKGGWEAIIPFYSDWVKMEIAGLNWWWFLLTFAPIVLSFLGLSWLGILSSLFVTFNCNYNLSKKFNKGVGFAVCMTLFAPICLMILGFSKKIVYNNVAVSNNGVIPPTNGSNNSGNVNNNYQNSVQVQQNYNQPMNNQMYNQQPVQPVQPVQPIQPIQSSVAVNSCTKCGATVNPGDRFCMNCGNPIEQSVQNNPQPVQDNTCTKCGATVNPGDRFCMSCGNQL